MLIINFQIPGLWLNPSKPLPLEPPEILSPELHAVVQPHPPLSHLHIPLPPLIRPLNFLNPLPSP